ncbi:MAG: HD domain-containing protein [Bacilli bacterium]
MKNILTDDEYCALITDIINKEEFKKINLVEHHGSTRYEHSLKVSYFSFLLAKSLKLNYVAVARGGLLHDFFMSTEDRNIKDRFISTFVHPKYALKNATSMFDLNDIEKNIIRSHMFPINYSLPKYLESWLVSFVDKGVAVSEFCCYFKINLSYASNYLFLLLLLKLH